MGEEEGCKEYKKGLWTAEEDKMLLEYVKCYGKGHWNSIAKRTGLKRCGKSCRLRWMNYLSPSVKKGRFTEDEEDLVIRLHRLLGNRWSLIAGRVPGRTDNQVKNYWNTHLSRRLGVNKKKATSQIRALVPSSSPANSNSNSTSCSGMNPSLIETLRENTTEPAAAHFSPHPENPTGKDDEACKKDDMRKMDSAVTHEAMEKEEQQCGMVIVGSQDYMTSSSSSWVSEFDKMMSSISESNSGCLMELIDGLHSFDLDWNQL